MLLPPSVKKQRFSITRDVLGSKIKATIADQPPLREKAEAALLKCMDECERIQIAFSRFLPDSQLTRLNKRVGEWVPVSAEMYLLLQFGEEIRKVTGGAFDVTIKSILEGWGYDAEYSFQEKERGKLGSVSFRNGNEVHLTAEVDLGGIGKGYALDRMHHILADFPNILIDAGGDLYARGTDETGRKWHIVFEHPTDVTMAIGETEVDDLFLAGSSPSRRSWRGFHHIVDPLDQKPADKMLMTYIQAKKGILADTLATALFVMGTEKALKLLPSLDIEAMLVDKDGKLFVTPGFKGSLFTN